MKGFPPLPSAEVHCCGLAKQLLLNFLWQELWEASFYSGGCNFITPGFYPV